MWHYPCTKVLTVTELDVKLSKYYNIIDQRIRLRCVSNYILKCYNHEIRYGSIQMLKWNWLKHLTKNYSRQFE